MKKFLVLYLSSVSAAEQMAKSTPEMGKAGMELWLNWAKSAAGAIVELGMPLGNPMRVIAGAVSNSDSKVSGWSILQADSNNAIAELLKNHPHHRAPGASIEFFEFLPMPGI